VRKTPVLPLALVALVIGIACGRISNHLTGTPEGLTGAGAFFFDGLGAGMLLAYWMMRRAGRSKTK
jgi:peptidoglycan/LPS O-acetylase OafA/YrhL